MDCSSWPKAFSAMVIPPDAEPVTPATTDVDTAEVTQAFEVRPKIPSRMMVKAASEAITAP